MSNIDTDQILPKKLFKNGLKKTGFGQYLFDDWRYLSNRRSNPEFILNSSRIQRSIYPHFWR